MADEMRVTRQECGCVLIECSCGSGLDVHLAPLGMTKRELFCDEHQEAFDRGEPTPTVFSDVSHGGVICGGADG